MRKEANKFCNFSKSDKSVSSKSKCSANVNKPLPSKKQKLTINIDRLPIVSSPTELFGKIVTHFCDISDDDIDEYSWHKGLILKRFGRSKTNYLIQYYELPDETFVRNIYSDFKKKDPMLVEVNVQDFVGAHIEHLFVDEESGKEVWWEGEIVDIDQDSEDKINPNFFVFYYEDGEEPEGEPEYFLEKMVEEY